MQSSVGFTTTKLAGGGSEGHASIGATTITLGARGTRAGAIVSAGARTPLASLDGYALFSPNLGNA